MRDFQLPGRSPVFASNGICATSHPLAARAAVRILEGGGNAVDAAIAAAVLLGICEPMMTGIGGDCFVLLKPSGTDKVIALNGSGRSPGKLSADATRAKHGRTIGLSSPEAVTVPGAIDAFCRLSDDWGKLGLAASLAPAIHYAKSGVPVSQRTSFDWDKFKNTPTGAGQQFYMLNGKVPKVGQVFRHPQQALVLETIAKSGRAGFYEGEVAQDMVNSLQALGGSHTLEDFANTSCTYSDPISGMYKGTELVEHPPNGQGATAILLCNILKHFDLLEMEPFGAQRAHIEAEAAKLAYDARDRFLADFDYVERLEHMLSPDTAASLAALIDPKRAMDLPAKKSANIHKETVYLTVVDKDLMAVSLIYSIYHAFGSGICSSKFGVLFQNRGAGFTLEEGHVNEIGGNKRPLHTIIPGMLKRDGKVIMPFGVMGGAYQPTGHARVFTNLIDFGMDPQAAIDAPRSFADSGALMVENGYSEDVKHDLADLGHSVETPDGPLGGAQAILIDYENGTLQGASDPRKDGAAIGY